jgi:hypothetical protein
MSKHLALTCPACGYEDFKWSDEQDENVPKEKTMLHLGCPKSYDLYGCPECSNVFYS